MKRNLNITSPEHVRALLARVPAPSYEMLARVAGAALQPNRNGWTSSTVIKWVGVGMPGATYQLVDAKLLLWERKIATWDEIITIPLKELLEQKWRRARGNVHQMNTDNQKGE
jgi:hypothetical protein